MKLLDKLLAEKSAESVRNGKFFGRDGRSWFKKGRGAYFSSRAQLTRRFKRLYAAYWFWILGAATIVAVLTISGGFQVLLEWEGLRLLRAEGDQIASATVKRVESRLNATVSVLRSLAENKQTQCGGRQMIAFAEAAKGLTAVTRVSLVDSSGFVMCSTAPERAERTKLLPQHTELHPRVTIVQPDPRLENIIVVSWHVSDGLRVTAMMNGDDFRLDAPPAIFLGRMHRIINLNGGSNFTSDGLPIDVKELDTAMRSTADGRRFPVQAVVLVPDSVLQKVNGMPRALIPVAILGILVLVGATLVRLNRTLSETEDTSIETALDDGQIQPMFQPLIDLTSGRVLGAEILMRWQKKDGTIARPGDFIHRVEQANLTCELTVSLLNSAIRELGETYREMPSMTLSINLFPRDIKNERIVGMVDEALRGQALRSEQIIFEITERRGLDDIEAVQSVLAGLSKLGARIALDNAGAGHLGLSGLRQLWPDVVKIDKVLVDALGREDNARSIIDTIVSLADELAIGIVAEGVENIDQMQRLNSIGVTAAQGYLFSKPLTATDFKDYVKRSMSGDLARELEEMRIGSQAA
ncbi:MAG: EAL domain-containing protein [Pseudomonadota bacterium]